MKESIVFYKSFYDVIKELPKNNQLEIYNAIFNKYFYGKEPELSGLSKGIIGVIIPNIDSANKRYFANQENGKKGGRPKSKIKPNENPNETQLKPNHNLNVNDNDNVNVNDNDNITTILYNYVENIFGRTLNILEIEKIDRWLLLFEEDAIKYAFELAILNNKKTFAYVDGIIKNWSGCNYKTLEEIKSSSVKETKYEKDWMKKYEN